MLSRPAYSFSTSSITGELKTDATRGLDQDEAAARLLQFGRNELEKAGGVHPIKILIHQTANAMTLVLILAMAVSFGIGSWIEGGVIACVILLNITVSFFQDYSAEKTMESLRALCSPTAKVVRDGETKTVVTAEIVPGDLVEMRMGDLLPADVRLLEAVNFEVDEAFLTGESLPIRKDPVVTLDSPVGLGDRINIAFGSSRVTRGRATGVVFATGKHTEVGAIASALRDKSRTQAESDPDKQRGLLKYFNSWSAFLKELIGRFLGTSGGTPLQQKLSKLALFLFVSAIVCAIIVLAVNKFSNEREVVIYAVATGLSMIPASLIVVLTITMAAGTRRMVARNVIVRNLKSLEALGAVTNICSDKTGTLTQGQMTVKNVWIPSKGEYTFYTSEKSHDASAAEIEFRLQLAESQMDESCNCGPDALGIHWESFIEVASLANVGPIHLGQDGRWMARGDPTEIAIQVFAARFTRNRISLTSGDDPQWKHLTEFSFDSETKRLTVVYQHSDSGEIHVFSKGAVEKIIMLCTKIYLNGSLAPTLLTPMIRQDIMDTMNAMAAHGLRVLALASGVHNGSINDLHLADRDQVEADLIFRGLIGIYDPPRPESLSAVRLCHDAGIVVHMLTGDFVGTAKAIAEEVGILPERMHLLSKDKADAAVMTADRFDGLTDAEIDRLPMLPLVIARCTPTTKVRMIKALHRRKGYVAMTGDGVNDSPSLKYADVGIAMGSGSDVAKEASDIVLTDDNFASIVSAVEEGRRISDNIQRFILHVLAENIAQACTLLVGLVYRDGKGHSVFPLSPVQIIWIIMATSGMPDMGLGFEPAAKDILKRPPRSLKMGIFTAEFLADMMVYGLWVSALCLTAFTLRIYAFGDGQLGDNCNNVFSEVCTTVYRARATCFACLTWFALFLAWELVDFRQSFFEPKPWSHNTPFFVVRVWRNQFLFWAIILGFFTVFITLYIPVINHKIFKQSEISWEWAIIFIAGLWFFVGVELWKWGKRVWFRRSTRKPLQTSM
ncbi:potassium/sodium efflux P-type ATPase, fungal-type [Cladophialophora bantiana CBS 173.52]|uniref:P-type Na(+) transporter n=1 Tax=Cladophialophora bantiana (strain ATCC 10958 / CBS 173.52 / CDC B-1940 / NIH 8579) TaxID=1442370 RepID=A0A0D2HZ76_CLAB1|nr:potassium/sodium efflux P-type ATPase, fungal-type [Cladophialophora bantiana CBS 173.52]KIW89894.1 potassium/sodium efflux P-type ATPase, fungal-type [Cladophialophora bantiana CBS 173.52]